MQFFSPAMLWTLGLIPVLVLLHLLKPKPKQVEVTNLFLWQEVFKERSSNLTVDRLRKNLPLLLQILIVILAALALAKPAWLYFIHQKGNIILVVDTSASMETRSAAGTRSEIARAKALELIGNRDYRQNILIIEAANKPILKTGFISDSQQAGRIIKSLKPSDAPGDLLQALYLALSLADPARDDTVYMISDGADGDISSLLMNNPMIKPILVDGGENNIGITKFEFRQQIDRKDNYEFMLEIKNFNLLPAVCPVLLSIDNTVVFENRLRLEAREKRVLIYPYSGILSGIARAELGIDDDFGVDNRAHLSLNAAGDMWVLLVSKGNYFLEKLLEAYPNFKINAVKEIIPTSWQEQCRRHDLVIVDRMNFPATGAGNFLLIDAYSPSIPIIEAGRVQFPQIMHWNRNSPLLKDIDLSSLLIENGAKVQTDDVLQPLIESTAGGLMYAYEKNRLRAVYLGFDITRSDLPLKVAYPVMMSHIINWLNPNKLDFSILQTQAGKPFDIYLNPQSDYFYTRAPAEKWVKRAVRSNPFSYDDTRKVGIYTIAENDRQRYFTVNLASEAESDIVRPTVDAFNSGLADSFSSDPVAALQPLWALFLLLGLVVLFIEWQSWLKND